MLNAAVDSRRGLVEVIGVSGFARLLIARNHSHTLLVESVVSVERVVFPKNRIGARFFVEKWTEQCGRWTEQCGRWTEQCGRWTEQCGI